MVSRPFLRAGVDPSQSQTWFSTGKQVDFRPDRLFEDFQRVIDYRKDVDLFRL